MSGGHHYTKTSTITGTGDQIEGATGQEQRMELYHGHQIAGTYYYQCSLHKHVRYYNCDQLIFINNAFLVEIGLNVSSEVSTYDVYITDFDTNTGWIQVVTGITYNQFPVIVNTDDYPDVNDSIKYKIVSDNGCECEGCPGEQITVQYAHEDINGQLTNFDGSNTTYSEMVTIICNYGLVTQVTLIIKFKNMV